jgi:hypothetical protein
MLARHLEPVLRRSLRHFPVVLLTGARQVGKSTLARSLADRRWPAPYRTLDDRAVLDAALTSPDGLVAEQGTPVILDEVQRAPDLLRAIKLVVDRDRRPGRFLLTGSANVVTLARVSETLAGRAAVHELHPFSLAERLGRPPSRVIDRLFAASDAHSAQAALPDHLVPPLDWRRFLLSGGFPTPALLRSHLPRRTWFDSYRQTYVERDVRSLSGIEHVPTFGRLHAFLLDRSGSMLNLADASRALGLPVTTLRRYFDLLVQTYQVFLVPPYASDRARRLVRTPRVYAADTGLACQAAGVVLWEDLARIGRLGSIVETWAATELRKLAAATAAPTGVYYWRTHGGSEVDFVLERGSRLIGLEIKASIGFGRRDLAGLANCRESHSTAWHLGLLLHGGDETIQLDDRTLAAPLRRFFA